MEKAMENKEKFNWWWLLIPLFIGGPFFFAPAVAVLGIGFFFFLAVIIPATFCRVAWKVFKWAWSR